MTATKQHAFPNRFAAYATDLDSYDAAPELLGTFPTRAAAEKHARIWANGRQTNVVKQSVRMEPTTGGSYIGVDQDGQVVRGTASNAALICRSKCIDAAERRGVPFVE